MIMQEGQPPQAQPQPSEIGSAMSSATVPGAELHLHHHAGRVMRSGKVQVGVTLVYFEFFPCKDALVACNTHVSGSKTTLAPPRRLRYALRHRQTAAMRQLACIT